VIISLVIDNAVKYLQLQHCLNDLITRYSPLFQFFLFKIYVYIQFDTRSNHLHYYCVRNDISNRCHYLSDSQNRSHLLIANVFHSTKCDTM